MESPAQSLIQARYQELKNSITHGYVQFFTSETHIKTFYEVGPRIDGNKPHRFSQVRLFTHRQLHAKRAVKTYSLSDATLTRDRNDVMFTSKQGLLFSNILNEISALSKLHHPNIIKIYEVFLEPKYIHIVMEFCKGDTLFELLRQIRCVPDNKGINFTAQILDAIRHIHSLRICHRGLWVENIMFSDRERTQVKIIGFGSSIKLANGNLTEKCGNLYYTAPEIFSGSYNEKCDIWSLGVTIYTMLVGSQPFQGETYGEIVKSIMKANILRPSQFKNLPGETRHFIKGMLKKDNRPSASELLDSAVLYTYNFSQKSLILQKILRAVLNPEEDRMLEKKRSLGNKLKYVISKILASANMLPDVPIIEKLWKDLDSNRNGELRTDEFQEGLTRFLKLQEDSQEKAKIMVKRMDITRNHSITHDVFISLVHEIPDVQNLYHAFNTIDSDSDGLINAEDIAMYIEDERVDRLRRLVAEVLGKEMLSFEDFYILIRKFAI